MVEDNSASTGVLYLGDKKYEIKTAYGSRNSLLINFPEKVWFRDYTEFDRFELCFNEGALELGKCLFRHEFSVPNYSGRLIFISDVYDFYKIFTLKMMANLEGYFQNLPLVLAKKNKIRESFRNYTSNLTYDLHVYQKYFDELDDMYSRESAEIYSLAQKTIIETQGRKFFEYFDHQLVELEKQTIELTREERENHAFFFRRQVWVFIKQSKFLTRTNIKPRGYPGDSEMMSMIYRDMFEGESIFARLMHKHPLETKSAHAVRNRKIIIPEYIEKTQEKFPKQETDFRILSVASGPARELENIIVSPDLCKKYRVTLLDQDTDALNEAANCIHRIENRFNSTIQYDFINESVRTMLRIRDLDEKWGTYHFIYSMGLFDYLSARVAQAVIEKLYCLLKPGGTLLVGNYHEKNPTKTYMDFWGDWVLYYRSEEELLQITHNLEGATRKIIFESAGCQMFLIVEKPF